MTGTTPEEEVVYYKKLLEYLGYCCIPQLEELIKDFEEEYEEKL